MWDTPCPCTISVGLVLDSCTSHGESNLSVEQMSHVMRQPAFCKCENKGADQLHGNCTADQHLCFFYIDSTITLLSKSEISSLWPSSVAVQPGLS